MKITSIKIDKLFEIFDYDIPFSNDENLLIITGPNGFGKTTILNIIFNLFNKKLSFFTKLSFEKITICLDNNIFIVISKKLKNDKSNVKFTITKNDEIIETFDDSSKSGSEVEKLIRNYLPLVKMDVNRWIDSRRGKILTTDDVITEYEEQLPANVIKKLLNIKSKNKNSILDSIKVHLIREQRLFRKVKTDGRSYREDKEKNIMIETIQTYANELQTLIAQCSQKSYIISQKLDSSYPNRLISETRKVSKEEYNIRFNKLKEKQEKLKRNGLYESKKEGLGYSEPDSKALLVYLIDLESKFSTSLKTPPNSLA